MADRCRLPHERISPAVAASSTDRPILT